jgi:hypothetical protein
LVVDLATVQLAESFRRGVDQLKADPTHQRILDFLRRFGTHFAHAVTFGSKSWEQRHETEDSVTDGVTAGTSQDQSVEAGYHGAVGGASGSISWGSQNEASLSTKKGTGSDVSSSGSVGSATEPVPILLEVEELTHLLSPVFFDDPYIYVDLREQVKHFFHEFPDELLDELLDYDDDPGKKLAFEIAHPLLPESLEDKLITFGTGPAQWIHSGIRYPLPGDVGDYLGGADNAQDAAESFSGPHAAENALVVEGATPISSHDVTREGKAFRCTDDRKMWWVRGGKRHRIADDASDFHFLPIGIAYWSDQASERDKYLDSGDPVTVEGKMVRPRNELREVWWISGGKRHLVPSEVVIDVLGGWQLAATVDEELLERFEASNVPTSVEGKMIRLADDPQVWVIHQRQRHKITNELGIRKRGGWQQVAIVREDVRDQFPESGTPAL